MSFHIGKNGSPAPCSATVRGCPLGGKHFSTEKEAESYLSEMNSTPKLKKKTKISINLDSPTEEALDSISKIGKPYVVGGVVRDSLAGSDSKDVDVEVHGVAMDNLVAHLKKNGYKVDEVGRDFGVLKVSKGKIRDLDVSVPRRENRVGAGHRSFEVEIDQGMTLQEAAERRDFTFNAIMYDPESKTSVDPSGGIDDFKSKTMRHVSQKFGEDPLRVLRGFQFAGRFEMQYHPETAEICRGLRKEYDSLPDERVREEWGKFYSRSTKPSMGIRALQESKWDDTIPGLRKSLEDRETVEALDSLPKIPKQSRRLVGASLIARNMDDNNAKNFLLKTLPTKKEALDSSELIKISREDLSTPEKRAWASRNHPRAFRNIENLATCTNNKDLISASKKAESEGVIEGPPRDILNGNEVSETLGRAPGKWVGEALHAIRTEQYSGRVTSKESARKFLLSRG